MCRQVLELELETEGWGVGEEEEEEVGGRFPRWLWLTETLQAELVGFCSA